MKKILVAADMPTHPCSGGNIQCILQYIKTLKHLGFDVYYLLIGTIEQNKESVEQTISYWGDHIFYYNTGRIQQLLQHIYRRVRKTAYPNNVDFFYPFGLNVFINKLHKKYNFSGLIVNYIWESKLAACNIPIKALYTHDVFAYRDERLKAGAYWHHYSVSEEAKAVRRFKNILAIQDVEREYFKYLSPKSNVIPIYSGFDYIDQPICHNKNILFFSGKSEMNLNGIKRFITDILPALTKYDPEIKLLIGGQVCRYFEKESLGPNIKIMGSYDNPSDFYSLGDIVINPVYEGTGLKIKTFEAISYGKVTIVDPHSAIGIFHPENAPLLIARDDHEYIKCIEKVWNDESIKIIKAKDREYINLLNKYICDQYNLLFSGNIN